MSFPVAIQVYSVREDAKKNLYGTLKKIKAMGYDGVEFAGLYGHTPEEVREMCADLGLTPISAHVPYLDMVADPEGVLSIYATIGCQYVVVPYLKEEHRPDTDNFVEVIKNVAMLGGVAKKLGMTLLYHNHDFEFITLSGQYGLDFLYDAVPACILKTEIDTCWVKYAGEDPAAYVAKYAGRCPVVHLKDYVGRRGGQPYALVNADGTDDGTNSANVEFEFRPVGHGSQNVASIVEAGLAGGAQWFVVEQDMSVGRTPLEAAQMSRDTLKALGI